MQHVTGTTKARPIPRRSPTRAAAFSLAVLAAPGTRACA